MSHVLHRRFAPGSMFTVLMLASVPACAEILSPEIVGGQISSQWPGVGAVVISLGGGGTELCTGFAITPRWVMTAAHCLLDASGPDAVEFVVGPDITSPDAVAYAIDQFVADTSFNINNVTAGHDAGLLHIKDVGLSVLPFKLNSQSLTAASVVGTDMLAMGYGLTGSGGVISGIKRIATVAIADLDSQFLYANFPPTGTCEGDSGGPAYVYDTDGFPLALGLTSFGDANCALVSAFQRIDAELNFITATVTAGTCMKGQSCEGIFRDGMEPPI